MPKFKKNPSPFQMKGMAFKEGQTPMKNLNSPLHGGLGDLLKGVFSAAEGAVKGVVQAGTGIIKGVTTDIKEGIEQVKENRANRQSQKSTTQSSEDDDSKKKYTEKQKIGIGVGEALKKFGANLGSDIDKGEIIHASVPSEQSDQPPDVTTIIASKDNPIRPIKEEDNPITKKSGFKMKKSPYKNYKKGYYGIK